METTRQQLIQCKRAAAVAFHALDTVSNAEAKELARLDLKCLMDIIAKLPTR